MLKTTRRAVAFASLACACMLAACGDAPTEAQKSAAPGEKKAPPPEVANIPADMVAAVSAGKVANAIGVHFALRAAPSVNKALPVEVALVPHRKFTMLRVHFETHEGLTIATGDTYGPVTEVTSEKPLTHPLVLLPTREGMFMVTVAVETEGEEGNVTRIFSIPVIVAASTAAR